MSQSAYKRRILLVDPEEGWLDFGDSALTKAGYAVATADSASDAHALLHRTRYDLILVNISEAEQSSTTVRQITLAEREGKHRTVVVSPISLSPTTIRNMFKVGADDCVAKQYNERGLLKLVDEQFCQIDSLGIE